MSALSSTGQHHPGVIRARLPFRPHQGGDWLQPGQPLGRPVRCALSFLEKKHHAGLMLTCHCDGDCPSGSAAATRFLMALTQ